MQDNYLIIWYQSQFRPAVLSDQLSSQSGSLSFLLAHSYRKGHEGQLCIWTNMHCCINLQPLCMILPELIALDSKQSWDVRRNDTLLVLKPETFHQLKCFFGQVEDDWTALHLWRFHQLLGANQCTLTGELPRGWPRSKIGYHNVYQWESHGKKHGFGVPPILGICRIPSEFDTCPRFPRRSQFGLSLGAGGISVDAPGATVAESEGWKNGDIQLWNWIRFTTSYWISWLDITVSVWKNWLFYCFSEIIVIPLDMFLDLSLKQCYQVISWQFMTVMFWVSILWKAIKNHQQWWKLTMQNWSKCLGWTW